MKKIKLIWDFRGANAEGTAIHHEIHFKEFAIREKLEMSETGVEEQTPLHFLAFLMVSEQEMKKVRDALIPHRGQLIEVKN